MIRSMGGYDPDVVAFGPFTLDRAGGVLLHDGRDVSVPPKAIGVLLRLLEHPGAVVTKEELLDAVWHDTAVTDGSLTEAVRILRGVLDDNPRKPKYIQTVHRRGYRFIAEVGDASDAKPATGSPSGRGDAGVAADDGHAAEAPVTVASRPPRTPVVRAAAWGLVGGLALITVYGLVVRDHPPEPSVALVFGPPPDRIFFAQSHNVAISPDGTTVVFSATSGADSHLLYARRLDQLSPRALQGTVDRWTSYPFFAPDGQRVGYVSFSRSIEVVDLASGDVEVLCDRCLTGVVAGATFANDGSVLFSQAASRADGQRVIWRLTPGGEPSPLSVGQDLVAGVDYVWPHRLPGDEWILVTLRRGHTVEGSRVAALNMVTGEHRFLIDDGFNGRYVAGRDRADRGHLVFGRAGNLWVAAFDAEALQIIGPPVAVPLEKPVAMSAESGSAGFDISPSGDFVYHPGVFARHEEAVEAVDPDGVARPLVNDRAYFRSVRISPDNTKLAACARDNRDEIRVYDLREPDNSFTIRHATSDFCSPVWSPDGRAIAFVADNRDVYVVAARRHASIKLLVATESNWVELAGWSPDDRIIYSRGDERGGDIWTVDMQCHLTKLDDVPCAPQYQRPLFASARDEVAGRLSPDGQWLSLSIDWVVHVTPFSIDGTRVEVAPGTRSRWASDAELVWYDTERKQGWLTMPWQGPESADPGAARGLRPRVGPEDFMRDGSLIRTRNSTRPVPTEEIVVITGWADRLRQLAPAIR